MEKNKSNLWMGGLLVVVGLLYLLNNLDFIVFDEDVAVAVVFLGLGAFLFFRFSQSKSSGVLVAASIATFIGLVVWLESVPGFNEDFFGVLFLWGAAALFAYGFLRNTDNWGFLIPAGMLFTIGSMVWLEMVLWDDDILASVFFLGLGLTFGFLYLVRTEKNKLDWARVPAICLGAFSAFLFLVTSDSRVAELFFPFILILVGGTLVFHATKQKAMVKQVKNT